MPGKRAATFLQPILQFSQMVQTPFSEDYFKSQSENPCTPALNRIQKKALMSPETDSTPSPQLSLRTQTEENFVIIHCSGRLISENVALLKSQVKALLPQQKRIVLDLTELTRMDSSGLGALVSLYISARNAHCSLQLINLSKQIRDLLGLSNLLSVFEDCGRYGTRMP